MNHGLNSAFFASSLVSAYWNGAATYYRGLVRSLHARGQYPQHETSLALLVNRETARLFDEVAMDVLGPYAPLRTGAPHAQLDGEVEVEYRDHLYFQFAAGGFDITRNVVATRGLGLPR